MFGTRLGASAIAVWALLKHLGRAGYRAVVEHCLKLTWKLTKQNKQIDGIDIVTEPMLNVIGIKSDTNDYQLIFQELRKRSWAVSLFPSFIRFVIMPHTKDSHIRSLLKDFKSVLEKLNCKNQKIIYELI